MLILANILSYICKFYRVVKRYKHTCREGYFFHAAYDATLAAVYGDAANLDNLVIEGGVVA